MNTRNDFVPAPKRQDQESLSFGDRIVKFAVDHPRAAHATAGGLALSIVAAIATVNIPNDRPDGPFIAAKQPTPVSTVPGNFYYLGGEPVPGPKNAFVTNYPTKLEDGSDAGVACRGVEVDTIEPGNLLSDFTSQIDVLTLYEGSPEQMSLKLLEGVVTEMNKLENPDMIFAGDDIAFPMECGYMYVYPADGA